MFAVRVLAFVGIFFCLFCSQSTYALQITRDAAATLLPIESVSDWVLSTGFVTFAYVLTYIGASSIFEYTNPAVKDAERMAEIKKELQLGIVALIFDVAYATLWLWLVDPYTPYYAYFSTHEHTIWHLILGAAVYFFWMDTWFYWTHRFLHIRWAWRHIHYIHHSLLKPTAFAQDAVHPFEAVLQGPFGHHLATIFVPIHPVAMAVYGFLTAVYAIAAHDGRSLDLNGHMKHHTHKHVNYGLYWGFWDYVCGTRYTPKQTPVWTRALKTLEEDTDPVKLD
eukprot:GILJ01000969.1.p1 GENE.GILJ01000969.1~~GILJ01000969.1.p1  ORF type:complete len:280 (+),score=23.11 GILJ01000969.1:35-874(+)